MFKKILVCLDGSKLAEQILPYVLAQAQAFNSDVELVQVVLGIGEGTPTHHETLQDLLKEAESAARAYLEKVAISIRAQGIPVSYTTLVIGPVGYAIVNYAHDASFDSIALATHGRGGLRRVLVGSVADYILKKSGLPILIIRPR